jgi:selenocysteine lyase/cysteine desulfurase
MRPDARRFETWERYVAGQIGLGVAARYAASVGMSAVQARVTRLADRLRTELRSQPGVTVLDRGEQQSALVTFVVEGQDSAQLAAALRADGINVSTTDAAEQRYDRTAAPSAVRASVHYYTTDDELDRLVASVSPRRAG